MARSESQAEDFTLRRALEEAAKLLEDQFGEVDQDAAVQLATFLYGAHARDQFLKGQHEQDIAYGGAPSSF